MGIDFLHAAISTGVCTVVTERHSEFTSPVSNVQQALGAGFLNRGLDPGTRHEDGSDLLVIGVVLDHLLEAGVVLGKRVGKFAGGE